MTTATAVKGLAEWKTMHEAYSAIFKLTEFTLLSQALSLPQFLTLAALREAGKNLTIGELAHGIVRESQTMTGIIDRLETLGLVERIYDRVDRRKRWIRLTEAGRRKVDAAAPIFTNVIGTVFHAFSEDELLRLRSGMIKLRDRALAFGSQESRV